MTGAPPVRRRLLGSALREYGSVSGRRHDLFDKIPLGENKVSTCLTSSWSPPAGWWS